MGMTSLLGLRGNVGDAVPKPLLEISSPDLFFASRGLSIEGLLILKPDPLKENPV